MCLSRQTAPFNSGAVAQENTENQNLITPLPAPIGSASTLPPNLLSRQRTPGPMQPPDPNQSVSDILRKRFRFSGFGGGGQNY